MPALVAGSSCERCQIAVVASLLTSTGGTGSLDE
jgi:hypothetical protein